MQPAVGLAAELARVADCAQYTARCGPVRACVGTRRHQRTSLCCGTVCCVFVLLAVLLCRFGAWLPSICSRTHHHPDRSCARRLLWGNQLSGLLPSSLGSLTGLYYLYVVVLTVSASNRGATNALVFAAARFCVLFLCWPCSSTSSVRGCQISAHARTTPIVRARTGGFRTTSCQARCRARSGRLLGSQSCTLWSCP